MLKKLIKSGWLALLCACCQLASAASGINVSATPANPAAPANVTLAVTLASGSDPVMVTQVEYFAGSQSLGKALAAPYTLAVSNMAAGTYVITAKAAVADTQGAILTSPALKLTVAAPAGAAKVYFIHSDQLNTPRAVTNNNGDLVWNWDSAPFGNEAANERPAGKEPFVMNLRFPGQYYDKETNLHYNYFRDYDPALGRYIQSDPIGLKGGINTFAFVGNMPGLFVDLLGLSPSSPLFKPGFWNDNGRIQYSNNCYSYSADNPNGHKFGTKPQPGEASGREYTNLDCDDISNAAKRDGFTNANENNTCPSRYHRVDLVIAPDQDYHWYRQDADGTFSHKPGHSQATRYDASGKVISDPSTADRDYSPSGGPNYSTVCKSLCAPNR